MPMRAGSFQILSFNSSLARLIVPAGEMSGFFRMKTMVSSDDQVPISAAAAGDPDPNTATEHRKMAQPIHAPMIGFSDVNVKCISALNIKRIALITRKN